MSERTERLSERSERLSEARRARGSTLGGFLLEGAILRAISARGLIWSRRLER